MHKEFILFSELKEFTVKVGERTLTFKCEEFQLPAGVTVIKGDNGIGKTQLLKAVIGYNNLLGKDIIHTIDGKKLVISSPLDAIKKGIRTFFQSDLLFNTLTLTEIVSLYGEALNQKIDSQKLREIIKYLGGSLFPEEIDHIEDLSNRLSMGQQAIAKLSVIFYDIFADEIKGIDFSQNSQDSNEAGEELIDTHRLKLLKLIILDEVFASLSYENKIKVLKFFKSLLKINPDLRFLVVTHSPEEVVWWKPKKIYEITLEGETRVIKPINKNSAYFVPNFLNLEEPIPIYSYDDKINFKRTFVNILKDIKNRSHIRKSLEIDKLEEENILFVCDENAINGKEFKNVYPMGVETEVVFFKGGENTKNTEGCWELIRELSQKLTSPYKYVVIIGGGSLLNSAGFACSVVNRGLNPVIYIPTTILAAGDVAVGSKTACNFEYKHRLGTYYNPDAIVILYDFIEKFVEEKRELALINLVESYKHYLFQDFEMLNLTEEIITNKDYKKLKERVREIIESTISLKSELMVYDFYETNIGKILLFGHFWARLIETVSNYAIPHDAAVWIGILIDLYLNLYSDGKEEVNILKSDIEDIFRQKYDNKFLMNRIKFIESEIIPLISKNYGHTFEKLIPTLEDENFEENYGLKDTKKELLISKHGFSYKLLKISSQDQYKAISPNIKLNDIFVNIIFEKGAIGKLIREAALKVLLKDEKQLV